MTTRVDPSEMTDEERERRRIELRHPRWDWIGPESKEQALRDARRRVLATRCSAERLVERSSVDPDKDVVLDMQHIEVVSPSFVDQLLRCWPRARFENMNDDVRETVELVQRRRSSQ